MVFPVARYLYSSLLGVNVGLGLAVGRSICDRCVGPIAAPTPNKTNRITTPITKHAVKINPHKNDESTIPHATFPIHPGPGVTSIVRKKC
jgi:hypothetical protein